MASTEWEYKTIENNAPKGKCFESVPYAQFTSEAAARLTFWYKRQNEIMSELQPLFDEGWEPVGEIGPGCLIVSTSAQNSKGIVQTLFNMSAMGYDWWLIGIKINLRRRLNQRSSTPSRSSSFTANSNPTKEFLDRIMDEIMDVARDTLQKKHGYLGDAKFFVATIVGRMEYVKTYEDLNSFLLKLATEWPIFQPLYIKYKRNPEPSSAPRKFCTNCGEKVIAGDKFCMKCGTRL